MSRRINLKNHVANHNFNSRVQGNLKHLEYLYSWQKYSDSYHPWATVHLKYHHKQSYSNVPVYADVKLLKFVKR